MKNIKDIFWGIFALVIVIALLFQGGRWLYENITWFKKVDAGDIYENQLSQKRFMITEARRGAYYIDSLQQRINYLEKGGADSIRLFYVNEIHKLNYLFEFALNHKAWLLDMDNYLSEFYSNESTMSFQVQERRRNILEAFNLNHFPADSNEVRKIIRDYGERIESTGISIWKDSGSPLNFLPEREFNELKKEQQKEMKDWSRGDTYFRCNDYLEFDGKYNKYGWLNADIIDSKLYKKIN